MLHGICSLISLAVVVYYFKTKDWVASNLLALAFATNAVQLLALDSFKTGGILLSTLFIYDIFWVFGTEVMVSVAKKFDGPIKVLWPKNIFDDTKQFSMLGLGDIVVPGSDVATVYGCTVAYLFDHLLPLTGIFIALCLRYDYHLSTLASKLAEKSAGSVTRSRKEGSRVFRTKPHHAHLSPTLHVHHSRRWAFPKPYFTACFISYISGLLLTMFVMHTFQAAQPALLYLSPACLPRVGIMALVRGELTQVMAYSTLTTGLQKDTKKTA